MKRENGDVYDWLGAYDEDNVVYGMLMDGVVVPV